MAAAAGVIGIVGAGTMGAGIAQLASAAGARTLLYDADEGALAGGLERVADGIARWRAKGRLQREPAPVTPVSSLDGLADAELVIEAAPERLELKRELFAALAEAAPGAVLASNTSSIPITAIGGAVADPGRVVGMHFFNPPALMELVEVIAGVDSSPRALELARATGRAMGKRVIDAADGPGFLVNRCNRPFGLEALRLVQDGVAGVETIDAIVRGAGFRMGPFELQDLVGIDVGYEVALSFHELSFGEPRWRPSPLSARMVAAGRLGRKSGRGWYAYPREPPADPDPPDGGGGDGRTVVVAGDLILARELRAAAAAAGFAVRGPDDADGEGAWLAVDCGAGVAGGPLAILCAAGSLHTLDGGRGAVGFHAVPPLRSGGVVELTRTAGTDAVAAERAGELFAALGTRTAWVGDAPGLVLGRIAAQLVNEACFAVGEGVGSAADVDAGMVLGLNHPRGPFAWCDAMGAEHALTILDALRRELGEERYRAAPLLRRMAPREPHAAGVPHVQRAVTQPPFQRFLDAHRDAVWRFLVAAVGRDAADDCFQETFLAALRAYPRMRPHNPRAWVLTIAHRKAMDHFRARARRPVPAGDDLPVTAVAAHEPGDEHVWDRVRELPRKQRAAVLLRFAGDLSHREVATALGVSEEAARRSAFEGLRKLRQEMTP